MLLKPGSKRRRSQAEIAMAHDEKELEAQVQHDNEQRIRDLERTLEAREQEVLEVREYKNIIEQMIEAGVGELDENNQFTLVNIVQDGPNEIGNGSEFA